jgi:undecaprenyl pyrophosphate synthase
MLGKLFKRKKTLKSSPALKICIIDDTTSDLWVTLGITDERRDEIIKLCKNAYVNHDTKTGSYEEIVDKCRHINEVVTACIIFERYCEMHNNPIAGLMKMFSNEDDK